MDSSEREVALYLHPRSKQVHSRNPCRMNTYAQCAANPSEMNTCRIAQVQVPWNEHLQKARGRGYPTIVTFPSSRVGGTTT